MSRALSEINSCIRAGLSMVLLITEADLTLRQAKLIEDVEGPGLSSTSPERSKRNQMIRHRFFTVRAVSSQPRLRKIER